MQEKLGHYIEKSEEYFLMRSNEKTGVLKEVANAPYGDSWVEYKWENKTYKLRVIRFPLTKTENEVLVTNIPDVDLTMEDFKVLYFMRWGIESKYHEIKESFVIENFTGIKPVCVEQDIYACLLMSNMKQQ